jgi:hypothetical protein
LAVLVYDSHPSNSTFTRKDQMNMRVFLAFAIVVAMVVACAGTAQAYNIPVPPIFDSALTAGTMTTATSAWTASGWTVYTKGSNTNILNASGISTSYLQPAPDGKDVMYCNASGNNALYPTSALFQLGSGYTYTMTMSIAGATGNAGQSSTALDSKTGFAGCFMLFYDLTKSSVIAWTTTSTLQIGSLSTVLQNSALQNGPNWDPQNLGTHLVSGESLYTTGPNSTTGSYSWNSGYWGTVGIVLPTAQIQTAVTAGKLAYGDNMTIIVASGNSGNAGLVDNVQITAVPEPTMLWMLLSAVPLFGVYRWRRNAKKLGRSTA